jgi:isoleucyl-tRNA synthetase
LVIEDSSTDIVHQALYFGEDDYRVCVENDDINKDIEPVLCSIDV